MSPPGKKRILLADPNTPFRTALARMLTHNGYQVNQASTPNQMFHLLSLVPSNLLIVDINFPHTDNIQLLRRLRDEYQDMAVIILTADATIDTAIEAIKLGIEDYLLKPVMTAKIFMAVHRVFQLHDKMEPVAMGKTTSKTTTRPPSYTSARLHHAGELFLDSDAQTIFTRDAPHHPVLLNRQETILLATLMSQANQVLSFGELAIALWGESHCFPAEKIAKALRPHIYRLRKKLKLVAQYDAIVTVRQKGYLYRTA